MKTVDTIVTSRVDSLHFLMRHMSKKSLLISEREHLETRLETLAHEVEAGEYDFPTLYNMIEDHRVAAVGCNELIGAMAGLVLGTGLMVGTDPFQYDGVAHPDVDSLLAGVVGGSALGFILGRYLPLHDKLDKAVNRMSTALDTKGIETLLDKMRERFSAYMMPSSVHKDFQDGYEVTETNELRTGWRVLPTPGQRTYVYHTKTYSFRDGSQGLDLTVVNEHPRTFTVYRDDASVQQVEFAGANQDHKIVVRGLEPLGKFFRYIEDISRYVHIEGVSPGLVGLKIIRT